MRLTQPAPPYPPVCIAIPIYNGARYLREAIRSALDQTYPNVHIIAVDNASTDETRAILAETDGLTPFLFDEHVPVDQSWNRAAALAPSYGDYLLILSADDILMPRAVEDLVGALLQHPDHGISYGQADILKEGLSNRVFGQALAAPHVGHIRDVERHLLRFGNTLATSATLFRCRDQTVDFRTGSGYACDFDLLLRLGQKGVKAVGIEVNVALYREHGEALSSQREVLWSYLLGVLAHHAATSQRPTLYYDRISRILMWVVIYLVEVGQQGRARHHLQTYKSYLGLPMRLLLESLVAVPPLRFFPKLMRSSLAQVLRFRKRI